MQNSGGFKVRQISHVRVNEWMLLTMYCTLVVIAFLSGFHYIRIMHLIEDNTVVPWKHNQTLLRFFRMTFRLQFSIRFTLTPQSPLFHWFKWFGVGSLKDNLKCSSRSVTPWIVYLMQDVFGWVLYISAYTMLLWCNQTCVFYYCLLLVSHCKLLV